MGREERPDTNNALIILNEKYPNLIFISIQYFLSKVKRLFVPRIIEIKKLISNSGKQVFGILAKP